MTADAAISLLLNELVKAEVKHPGWPLDKIHCAAIMIEEAGECVQAAIDYEYMDRNDINLNRIKKEAAQCGAMAIRLLMNME